MLRKKINCFVNFYLNDLAKRPNVVDHSKMLEENHDVLDQTFFIQHFALLSEQCLLFRRLIQLILSFMVSYKRSNFGLWLGNKEV